MKHPNQPLILAEDGRVRFKKNKIVDKMLEFCTQHGYSLNEIAIEFYNDEDYVQLMQLIGYSIQGYGELRCISNKEYNRMIKRARKVKENNNG